MRDLSCVRACACGCMRASVGPRFDARDCVRRVCVRELACGAWRERRNRTGRGESWGAGFGAGKDEPKDACYPTPDYTVSESSRWL